MCVYEPGAVGWVWKAKLGSSGWNSICRSIKPFMVRDSDGLGRKGNPPFPQERFGSTSFVILFLFIILSLDLNTKMTRFQFIFVFCFHATIAV